VTEHESQSGGSPEERVDLSGLNRLSDKPPPPRGETGVRVVRALSILLLAIAAAGLPWYFVTRSSDPATRPPLRSGSSPTTSASPSPTASPNAGTFEVFGVQNCANLRAEPSTSSARLDCLVPGVRLESDGRTQQAGGLLWRQVRYVRRDVSGWMADQYLKPV
jgi:hypothetical protein